MIHTRGAGEASYVATAVIGADMHAETILVEFDMHIIAHLLHESFFPMGWQLLHC